MKVLITGAAGYLGSTLVPYLLTNGHHVTAADSLMYGGESLAAVCHDKRFNFVREDVRNTIGMDSLYSAHDLIIPLAAIVGATACNRDRSAAQATNAVAVEKMCGKLSNDQRVIIPSTQSGYGTMPDGVCTEVTPVKPITLYGRTKVAAERAVMQRQNSISLRLATVFGCSPRMRSDLLVNDLVQRAVTDRSVVLFEWQFRRAVVHIRDVALTFLHAIDNFESMRINIYNVACESLTKSDLCDRIGAQVPMAIFRSTLDEDVDKRDYAVSTGKLEATGWCPAYTLDDGIRELAMYFAMTGRRQSGNA